MFNNNKLLLFDKTGLKIKQFSVRAWQCNTVFVHNTFFRMLNRIKDFMVVYSSSFLCTWLLSF